MKNKSHYLLSIILTITIALSSTTHSYAQFRPLEKEKGESITVLLYHHLLEDKDIDRSNSAIITVKLFEEHMAYLSQNGYTTLTLADVESFIYEGKSIPDKSVLITFDDGYQSNYEYAYPILKKYNLNAVLFPATVNIEEKTQQFNPDIQSHWSYEQFIDASDVFELGSHSHDLHHLSEDGTPHILLQSDEFIKQDLAISRLMLGNTIGFAYPNGAYKEATITYLQEAGFKLAFTTKSGDITRTTDPYKIPRYGIFPWVTTDRLEYILTR